MEISQYPKYCKIPNITGTKYCKVQNIAGITEIVDVVNLEALDARLYHEPRWQRQWLCDDNNDNNNNDDDDDDDDDDDNDNCFIYQHAEWWTVQYSSQWTGLSSSIAIESGEFQILTHCNVFAIQCNATEYNTICNVMQCLACSETMYFTPILRSDDCIFNPVSKVRGREGREEEKEYNVQLSPMQVISMVIFW